MALMSSSAGYDADAVIAGAGLYGTMIALELKKLGFDRIILAESASRIMTRASHINQARVHSGYHYPRSTLTGFSSHRNFARFCDEFAFALTPSLRKYYAIAAGSRVSPTQYEQFCRTVGIPLWPAERFIRQQMDPVLIPEIYRVQETSFDAAKVAQHLTKKLIDANIDLRLNTKARFLSADAAGVECAVGDQGIRARYGINATYAMLDQCGIPVRTPIKREWAEVALIKPLPGLPDVGITVMDGPFFSVMPFPSYNQYCITHVRYTPIAAWETANEIYSHIRPGLGKPVNAAAMIRDAARYMPALRKAEITGSLFDVKAILMASEGNDGRPILYEHCADSPRMISVLGGKLDNVYDVLARLKDDLTGTG